MEEDYSIKIPDYITFARTFENYKWYKPILVFVIGLIALITLQVIVFFAFNSVFSFDLNSLLAGGYDSLDPTSPMGIFTFIAIALVIPSLYIASRIVRDRPFSSYSSSRGGWDMKIFLKCLTVPFAVYLIVNFILFLIRGPVGDFQLTLISFFACLIFVPLQCIAEEYLYRGFLMQTFGSWFKIPVLALILQAILFGASHSYNILGIIATLIMGLACGFLTYHTKGLEAGSALHTINNLFAFYMVAIGLDTITSNVTIVDFVIGLFVVIVLHA